MSEILLSICLSGRNDDYGRDFKRRFVQSMNFLAWSAKQSGVLDRLEVVFTDWNSDAPLAEELKFSPEAAPLIRFIEVPPGVAGPLNYGDTPFHTGRSLNVAFRRARGEFIAMMPADVLMTRYALERLLALLDGRISVPFDPRDALLLTPRRNIANYADEARFFTSPETIEALLLEADFQLRPDRFVKGVNSGGGMFLLSRDRLFRRHGIDEAIGGWGGSDIVLALDADVPVRNLSGLGIVSYDFEVDRRMTRQKRRRRTTDGGGPSVRAAENEKWGMPDRDFAENHAKTGAMTFPPPPEFSDPVAELASRTRFLPLRSLPRISASAVAAGVAALNREVKSVLLYAAAPDVAAMLSLAEPWLSLTFCDASPERRARCESVAAILAATRHHGAVAFPASVPETGFDLVISPDPLPGKAFQVPGEKLFIGGKISAKLEKTRFFPLDGNLFSRLRFPEKWPKLRNILGRLPLRRWSGMLQYLSRHR